LIDGIGLKDAGLIAYPISLFSLFCSVKASFHYLICTCSVYFCIYWSERTSDPGTLEKLVNCYLRSFITGIAWAVMANLEQIYENLRETYDLTLIGWGKALEYRDRETEGHSQRVVKMTVALAERLGIPEYKMEHIRRGALLHDIGKMAVPDAILLKCDNLSDSEWEVVKMHPIHAKNLLENIPFLRPALDIPYSHHERWDGSGYPEGLSKEDIPFAARIFAVVDVWDALISNRPIIKHGLKKSP
jgi:putative nucleotidyltransferase with HDIG domain